jgi:2,4-dienoyl-CoA reductase-like NADH-dependent reductase (Old Yellow Enzyme family)
MIQRPFTLPCGATLKNRIAKAAMTERLARKDHLPNELHARLYQSWAGNGTGLLISGNIMVSPRYLESGGNIVLDAHTTVKSFKKWTMAGTQNGSHFWAQINHPGRQATIFNTRKPVSASNVKLKKLGLFARPRALRHNEVLEIRDQFIATGKRCKEVGFTGIQIHAAHGYLLSQFLSPITNLRTDQWGGSIENRARLLIEIVRGIRSEVGHHYPVSVKINSADFQRGGFDEHDSMTVIRMLEAEGIDLLEISGGTYEKIEFLQNAQMRSSTKGREAYFLDFAQKIRQQSSIPLMVTGGFRSLSFCNGTLKNNALDIIGFARPYLIQEDFPIRFLAGEAVREKVLQIRIQKLQDMVEGGWYDYQIWRLAHRKGLDFDYSATRAVTRLTLQEMWKGFTR